MYKRSKPDLNFTTARVDTNPLLFFLRRTVRRRVADWSRGILSNFQRSRRGSIRRRGYHGERNERVCFPKQSGSSCERKRPRGRFVSVAADSRRPGKCPLIRAGEKNNPGKTESSSGERERTRCAITLRSHIA